MINRFILLVLSTFVSGTMIAQKSRVFLGHKNLLEANYSVYKTVMMYGQYNEREGDDLVKKDFAGIKHGLQLVYTRHLVGKMSFGLEFDYAKTIYAPHNYAEYLYPGSSGTHFATEKIDVNCVALIGKFEFGRKEGVFPIGVSHQVGGGLLIVAPDSRTGTVYAVSRMPTYETREVPYTLGSAKGFTAFYNLNFRASLSERLLLNFGFRYNFNYLIERGMDNGEIINEWRMSLKVNDVIGMNFMRFYTGLAFSF